jgi:hypothetical protein
MDILKAFSLVDESHSINIQGTMEYPLFQANQIGKLLKISVIRTSMIDFDDEEKVTLTTESNGGPQNTLFLTELGLYKLLGRSRKPTAHKFQKSLINMLREIRVNGAYELQANREIDKHLIQHKCDIINHNTFIRAFDNKNVVYLCKLKKIDETTYIIKIGCSQNVKERMHNIGNTYNCCEPILTDVFECDNYHKFEKFIHNQQYVRSLNYKMEIKNGQQTNETYLVSDAEYKEIIAIIKANRYKFTDTKLEVEKARIEAETLAIDVKNLENINIKERMGLRMIENQILSNQLELQRLTNYHAPNTMYTQLKIYNGTPEGRLIRDSIATLPINQLKGNPPKEDCPISNVHRCKYATVQEPIDDEIMEMTPQLKQDISTAHYTVRTRNWGLRVPRVYQYNPDDLTTPIKMFESPTELERQDHNISISGLKRAIHGNHIYKDFRWILVKRDQEPPTEIEPTVSNKSISTEVQYIAMIDIKKTKILEVYSTQKDAVDARNMNTNGFSRAIKNGSISSGHYWNYFNACSEEMKTAYLATKTLPEKHIFIRSKQIQQIEPRTGTILKTYGSKREIGKLFQMSQLTLNKHLISGEVYNGYIWQEI